MTDITIIISAVISLIGAIITVVIVPLIRSKTTSQQYATLRTVVGIGVYAAEQMFSGAGRGEEKKAYVKKFLEERNITFDSGTIDAAIEAEVKKLKLDEGCNEGVAEVNHIG